MQRIVPHTVPRVGRSYEHFPDGFELHLLPFGARYVGAGYVVEYTNIYLSIYLSLYIYIRIRFGVPPTPLLGKA